MSRRPSWLSPWSDLVKDRYNDTGTDLNNVKFAMDRLHAVKAKNRANLMDNLHQLRKSVWLDTRDALCNQIT